MTDAAKLAYALRYLRRALSGGAKTLDQLKALADQCAAAILAGETKVTITESTFEGGSSNGQVEFEAALVGQALETIIAESDPDFVAPPPRRIHTTVVLGPTPYFLQ
jgi:hypothetical protein